MHRPRIYGQLYKTTSEINDDISFNQDTMHGLGLITEDNLLSFHGSSFMKKFEMKACAIFCFWLNVKACLHTAAWPFVDHESVTIELLLKYKL